MDVNHSAPYAKLAVSFAGAIVGGDFERAHTMLSSDFRASVAPERLRANYEEMIEYGDGPPVAVRLITTMESWPDRQPSDLGWAYVAIEGDGYSEAVTVIVEKEDADLVIRHLEWGRP